jgi:hypothetical protein
MMLFGIRDYGPGRVADPRTPPGRAALYSLAFMMRRAAAVYLDIQDYELKAGIRSLEDPALGAVVGQIFLSDTLENGAGYATHLGTPAMTQDLLEMIARPTPREFYDRLIAPPHADVCDTSCPDCLRSYNNLAYHNLLDWRLAVDMAALALDPHLQLSLASPRWAGRGSFPPSARLTVCHSGALALILPGTAESTGFGIRNCFARQASL